VFGWGGTSAIIKRRWAKAYTCSTENCVGG